MTDFFTSDTHFGHVNIVDYCHRPFTDVEDMTLGLTARWNNVVGPHDTVYHLGDFAMGLKHRWCGYRWGLNGKIVLIRGNHDTPEDKIRAALLPGDVIVDQWGYYDDVRGIWIHLAHVPHGYDDGRGYVRPEPMRDEKESKFTYYFCGHVHDSWTIGPQGDINVGVDVRDYAPRRLDELIS